MYIISNGHADTTSNSARCFMPEQNKFSIQFSGNFGGAQVTIQKSLNDKDWVDDEECTDISEACIKEITAYKGYIRAVIKGGTKFLPEPELPKEWYSNTFYEKDIIVKDTPNNRYLQSKANHQDGMIPNMDFWEVVEYTPEEVDNSNATLVNVNVM